MLKFVLGRWTMAELDQFIREASGIKDAGERINILSRRFLGTRYEEQTLKGDTNKEEVMVVNLEGVDCFTFIDYIEAMRLSGSFPVFTETLLRVRYRPAEVSFGNRKHFFTDWREFNRDFVEDVTEQTGGQATITVPKILNRKKDGTYFVRGIPPVKREIKYIPSKALGAALTANLKTGDYAGIYSDQEGLDVSHVGIIIKDKGLVSFRHASSSSRHRKVLDEDFRDYISSKPGLMILRPK